MKICKVCGKRKRTSSFGPDARTSDGISKRCTSCVAEAKQAQREKAKAYNAKWRAANPDHNTAWRQANRGHAAHMTALHKQETPACLTEAQREQILAIYKKAAKWSDETGVSYHVDHICPRVGLDADGNHVVSGLHVPQNLQIVPSEINGRKGKALLEGLAS